MDYRSIGISSKLVANLPQNQSVYLETAPQVGTLLLLANGQVQACDEGVVQLLGYTVEQLIGTTPDDPPWQTIHPDGTRFAPEEYPAIVALKTRQPSQTVKLGFYQPSGALVWLQVDATPLFQHQSAEAYAVLVTLRSIAPDVQSDRERLAFVLKATGIGCWLNSLPLGELNWDERTKELFFVPPDVEPTIDLFWSRLHPEDREPTLLAVQTALEQRSRYEIEHRAVHPETGEIRWICSAGQATYDSDGTPVRFDGINYDITNRKATEARLQDTLASIREDFVVFDRQWHIRYLNAQAATTLQRPIEEILDKQFWELLPDLIGTEFYDRVQRVMHDRIPDQFEYYYEAFDTWLENRAYPAPDGIVHLCTDITQRKRAELNDQFLNQLEQRLQKLSDVEAMIWEVISSLGQYLNVDRCLWQDTDWEHQVAIVEHNWQADHLPPLTGTFPLAAFLSPDQIARFAGGQPMVVSDIATHPETAVWAQNYLPLAIHAFICVPCIQEGQWMAAIAVHSKVPRQWRSDEVELLQQLTTRIWASLERDRVAAELQQKNAILKVINEASPTPIFVKDRQGRILYANPATLEVLGKSEAEVVGFRDCDLYPHLEDALKVMENDQRIMDSGQTEVVEESPDGIRTFLGMKAPYCNSAGEVIGLIGIANDITERVQFERKREQLLQQEKAAREVAEQANRIKDEFLAVLSHELRTPMNPIVGWANLMKQGKLSPEKAQFAIEVIDRNAKLQVQLIDDLLDISRILQGKLHLNAEIVNLQTVIQAAIETVQLASEAKAIEIRSQIESCNVAGDPGRLQQVVWNLLSNAIKFTPEQGQIQITVTKTETLAEIQVSDTGKGIATEFLPYVFEHFRQEDGALTRRFGGLGLGLAIARQIVELHGGRLWADSPGEGQGATFTVQIPLVSSGLRAEDSDGGSELPRPDLSTLKILVVDDESDSLEFSAFALEQAGAIVTRATSGMEAVIQVQQFEFDAIVSDIGMPEMDGYQLLQKLQAIKQIPAIALTAYAGEYDQRQAISAGFDRHLAKPVNAEMLVRTVFTLCMRSFDLGQI